LKGFGRGAGEEGAGRGKLGSGEGTVGALAGEENRPRIPMVTADVK